MLKTWKEKLSLVFALALVICSFPLTAMAEEAAAPIGKGEILEYSLDPESAKAEETKTVSQGYYRASVRNKGFCGRYGLYGRGYRVGC